MPELYCNYRMVQSYNTAKWNTLFSTWVIIESVQNVREIRSCQKIFVLIISNGCDFQPLPFLCLWHAKTALWVTFWWYVSFFVFKKRSEDCKLCGRVKSSFHLISINPQGVNKQEPSSLSRNERYPLCVQKGSPINCRCLVAEELNAML